MQARKEIARIITACRASLRAGLSVHAGKLLRADVRNARSARSGARADDGRDGREDGGVRERDAADFEDGGVGRGQGVLRLVQEGGERHAADLEDVVERDDDDEGRDSRKRRRFRFKVFALGDLSRGFNSFERSNPAFLSRAWIDEVAARIFFGASERILLLLYNFISKKSSDNQSSLLPTST